MEFLNPIALYGIFALPLLLLPYLIRRKPRRLIFSSLLLLAPMDTRAGGRPWGRLHLPLLFFLQLLLLTLLILALSEPVFSVRPNHIAIVLDNSASMQTLEGSKTRFELAKERAGVLIGELNLNGNVDLYRTVPHLEPIRATPLRPSEAAAAIVAMEPYDLGEVPLDFNKMVNQMARERKYDRVYYLTDHPGRDDGGVARLISVGQPTGNLALSALQINRSSLADSRWVAKAEVQNFSYRDEKIKILLRGAGASLASRELVVPLGKSATAVFEGIPPHHYYEAEIDHRDALPLDNRRFAVPPKSQSLRILAISPRPHSLASLRNIPGVTLEIISPEDYEKSERTGYALEIFHFSTPAALPQNPALFVLPPNANTLVDLESAISRVVVSSWREPHVLTRYINFALFRPSYGRPLKPQTPGETIVESPQGVLVFAAQRQGIRYLVLGFDPFPYLGRENLPMSIFTLNFFDWFNSSGGPRDNSTGNALTFDRTVQEDTLVTPKGEKLSLKPGSNHFSATYYQGIYQLLQRGGEKQLFAVNLQDGNESDLRTPTPLEFRFENSGQGNESALFSSWPYLLLASLLLLLIEWFITPRWLPIKSQIPAGSAL